jgi:hypothetical protein
MAQFTRTHGDYQPVFHLDTDAYTVGAVNAVTSAATVQPQGPKLEYFTVTYTSAASITGAQMNATIQTIQQLATVYIYEYTSAASSTLAIAMYPVGAWGTVTATGAGTLDQAITDAMTAIGAPQAVTIAATATFTN